LKEEQRRVLAFLDWTVRQWEMREKNEVEDEDWMLRSGLEAYAKKQATFARRTKERFRRMWNLL
jgi:hypothetical protein